jgi:hypothetical protein
MAKDCAVIARSKKSLAATEIQTLKQYAARIASNACNDVLRTSRRPERGLKTTSVFS